MTFQIRAGMLSTSHPVKANREKCRQCGTWLVELDATASSIVANNGHMRFYGPTPDELPEVQPIEGAAVVQCRRCKEQWWIEAGVRPVSELPLHQEREVFRDPNRSPRKEGWSMSFYGDDSG
jgi:hypothetical protein